MKVAGFLNRKKNPHSSLLSEGLPLSMQDQLKVLSLSGIF